MENLPVTFSIYPSTIPEDRRECLVLLSRPVSQDVTVELQVPDKVKQEVKFEKKDDTTLVVKIPDNYFQHEKIIVYVSYNKCIIGVDFILNERPCEQLARILERALDPIQLMMESLGLQFETEADLHRLDNDLAHVVSSNLTPAHMKVLFQGYKRIPQSVGAKKRRCRFPTALHFAAHYGLEKLTEQLLMSEAALPCLKVVNCDGEAVIDIAQKNRFKAIERAVENALIYERVDDDMVLDTVDDDSSSYITMSSTRSSVPQLPRNPPPQRPRTSSTGGALHPIQEQRSETRVRLPCHESSSVTYTDKDSGVFLGSRDSNVSRDSTASGDSVILYSSEEGSGDGHTGMKLARNPHIMKIKRGDVLLPIEGGLPSVGHVKNSKRPSLPNLFPPSVFPTETEAPPVRCSGPTYQNFTQRPGHPPVPRKKTSLPNVLDMNELQTNTIFRKRQNSMSDET